MKKIFKKKKFIITFILLFIVVLVFIGMKKKNSKETFASVNLINLTNKSIEQIISVKSTLDGIEKAEVVSPLNYEIIDIKVKEGDIVSKNQVLAILDSEELKKDIIEAENQIELMDLEQQEKLRTMQIEYDKSILEIEELEKDYNKNKELFESEIITKEAFEKIENSLVEAKKAIESYDVVNGKIELPAAEEKRMEIQKYELNQKKENLEKVYIKSPIDGTVTRVNVNLGRYAKDTEDEKAMFVVENLDRLQMKVYISEFDINKIQPNQDVDIYSDVLGEDPAKGIVARISPTAEQKEANSMERVIPVLINVTEKPDNLIAGVLATAKIKVAKAENVFAIPSGALVQDENSSYKIYILNEDNSLKSIPVEIGLETDLETEIKGTELTEGMKVVVNPDITFTEGMIVAPNENEME